jgi:diguanylate cyclase (GGDEF)-like protein
MIRNEARRDGGTLRSRLFVLVLIPLLGLSGFAAIQVHSRWRNADEAHRVQQLVQATGELSRARAALLQELLPDLTRGLKRNPRLAMLLGLDAASIERVGPTDAQIAGLRRLTDARIARLAKDSLTADQAARSRSGAALFRAQIDSGRQMLLGFTTARTVVESLADAQQDTAQRAAPIGLSGNVNSAVGDLQRVSQLAQFAGVELVRLAGTRFPRQASEPEPVQAWLQVWSGYTSAVPNVVRHSAPQIAAAVRRVLGAPAARTFDQAMNTLVQRRAPVTAQLLLRGYRQAEQRDAGLAAVLELAVARALDAADGQRRTALGQLWLTLGLIALLVAISALLAWRVQRSLSRPLARLARSARKVSEGVLDDVPVGGPREVRTAARGLSAAVANLRKIESQAAAVAAGDLDGDVVRRALPGPLGAVVQSSIETIIGAIHERDVAKTDLAHRAAHDALTELPNRAHAMVMIEQALSRAQRTSATTGLMFVDLDFFKAVNDTFGHEAGDTVLRTAARRMQDVVRTGDTVARLGGDEFVVVLEDVGSEADFVKLADRVIETVSTPIEIGKRCVRIGASVGIAVCRDGNVDADRLLAEADAAAYRAKRSGRGRVGIFDDDLRDSLSRRAELEAAIGDGLAAGEFVLHYQPVVELRSGRPLGVEALIRWNRPGHGLLPPADFVPVAELSTLINDLGRWTLREATAQLARWDQESGSDELTVAVNVSGRHLASNQLVPDVRDALVAAGIDAHRLVVEITETVLVDDPIATANMIELRGLGVRVAIDDFGTGYTSIGQLPRLPIDTLKIDRSFVASSDPACRELVGLIVAAAHAFNLTVVAEGIELAEDVERLNAVAVESGQGFFFARPEPADLAVALANQASLPYGTPDPVADPVADGVLAELTPEHPAPLLAAAAAGEAVE